MERLTIAWLVEMAGIVFVRANEVVKKSSHMPRHRDFEGGQPLPSSEIVAYTSF
jgi:hypothetical protein